MNKKIFIRSIAIVFLILLVSSKPIVEAKTISLNNVKANFLRDRVNDNTTDIIGKLLDIIWVFIYVYFYIIFTLFP